MVSDIVLESPLSNEIKNDIEAYVGCIAGASLSHCAIMETGISLLVEGGLLYQRLLRCFFGSMSKN
jgi:hypothetical protein